jgi:hypothetical protein
VVVHDFDVQRPSLVLGPLETDPPPVVDPNRILAFAITLESLQTVRVEGGEVK